MLEVTLNVTIRVVSKANALAIATLLNKLCGNGGRMEDETKALRGYLSGSAFESSTVK